MSTELVKLDAEITFCREVLATIEQAAANRQKVTHARHRLNQEEKTIVEQFEVKLTGLLARKRRIEIVGR